MNGERCCLPTLPIGHTACRADDGPALWGLHGSVAKAVLISSVPPLMAKTAANPGDAHRGL